MSVPYSEGRKSFTEGLAAARRIRGICWARAVRPRAEITVSIPIIALVVLGIWVKMYR